MLLSNLTSHPTLVPAISSLTVPIVTLVSPSYPAWYLPAGASSSSTIHPAYRDPSFVAAPDQSEEYDVEGIRALVQAFVDGASPGVERGEGKRKGECHFLASVFANVSMVRLLYPACTVCCDMEPSRGAEGSYHPLAHYCCVRSPRSQIPRPKHPPTPNRFWHISSPSLNTLILSAGAAR